MQSEKSDEDCTVTVNETFTSVFEAKYPSKIIPSCDTIETYEETPIFIIVDITEEAV